MPDTIQVQQRSVIGKKVSVLRREGTLPGNVYGRHLDSIAVQLEARLALQLLREHGLNNLISLQVDGEPRPRPVVVRAVRRHPATHELQHIDFYQVDLLRPIQASVPVLIVGEAPAVRLHAGVLLQGAESVLVEALPADLPAHLEISVEGLEELDAQFTVEDLVTPANVTVLSPSDTLLARVARPRVLEEEGAAVAEGEEELGELEPADSTEDGSDAGADAE